MLQREGIVSPHCNRVSWSSVSRRIITQEMSPYTEETEQYSVKAGRRAQMFPSLSNDTRKSTARGSSLLPARAATGTQAVRQSSSAIYDQYLHRANRSNNTAITWGNHDRTPFRVSEFYSLLNRNPQRCLHRVLYGDVWKQTCFMVHLNLLTITSPSE